MYTMRLSIRQAAKATGVGRTTILRAIQSGKMSAQRKEGSDGYLIDPAELFRVFEPRTPGPRDTDPPVQDHTGQGGSKPDGQGGQGPAALHVHMHILVARLEERVKSLDTMLEMERRRAEEDRQQAEERVEDMRQERDAWRGQAEATQRQLVDLTARKPKGLARWFGWRV